MTPSQMLRRQKVVPEHEWSPVVRTKPIELPSGGVSHADLLFMEQSAALQMSKCPLCHAPVHHEVGTDSLVYFQCTRQPVFHEWRRPLSFLTTD